MKLRLSALVTIAILCAGVGAPSAAVIALPIHQVLAFATPPWNQQPGDLRLFPSDRGPAVTGLCPSTYVPGPPPIVYVHVKVQNAQVWWASANPPIPYDTAFEAYDVGTPSWRSPGAKLPSIAPAQSAYINIPFYAYNLGGVDLMAVRHLRVTVNPGTRVNGGGAGITESDDAYEHNNTITVDFTFPRPCGTGNSPYVLPSGVHRITPPYSFGPIVTPTPSPTPIPKRSPPPRP
jgi:hypothetical protein